MMQEPEVLLADEPIASLDPRSAEKVMRAFKNINESEGITVIASLHDLASARLYCERIIGMRKGRIVFDGTPFELTDGAAGSIYGIDDINEEFVQDAEKLEITALSAVK